ncbi:MAG: Glycosyltransferase [Phormidesmis priestleyi Ana]|uniref:Glycosyltransferase n=1 Tax=Phormidesmis priestleyi Ana TaxID=1666911 RepID=A0A0P7ZTS6_9CYAN|nr:MAG: Glycosyltransferase [Phormidesmis priestleyi Ana]
MRIAVIGSKGLPPHQGGIEHHCAEIYPRIVAAGHSVDLYARSSYNPNMARAISYKGVRVITVPSIRLRGVDALACSGLSAAIAALKRPQGRPYDIIHFHALGPSLFTPLPKLFSSAKILTTCHGLDWQRAKWGNFSSSVIKTGEQTAVRFADHLVVVSEALRDYFYKTYGKEATYIENAPVAYAHSDRHFLYGHSLGLTPQKYMVFVGRLVPEKRVDLLLKTFQRLRPKGWKLVLVGDKSDTDSFTAELLQLADNNPNIVFTGELQGPLLAEIVRGAGLFVLPSDVEGLPLALLEAMQENIPAVVSDIAVHRQMVGIDRGLTFKTGSLNDFQDRLGWAVMHPRQMSQMADRAGVYVRSHHNWETITRKYIHLYESLLPMRVSARSPQKIGSKRL